MTSLLPYCHAAALPELQDEQRWLIDRLWMHEGVGIVGGAPKCCKSWLGLDMALSVASGTPCLDSFAVPNPGRVLCYLAEDGSGVVKSRLLSMSQGRSLNLATLPIDVITAPAIRLDQAADQERLSNTVRALQPRMLLLDPFVRLHRIDENDAGQVSGVLAFLRTLQRQHQVSVVVVHHARKNGGVVAGQALRGSSDFHAWGDSNLYLRRRGEGLVLTVEHRAAAAPPTVALQLCTGPLPHLVVSGLPDPVAANAADALAVRLVAALREAAAPLSRAALRTVLHVRNETLGTTLATLTQAGTLTRLGDTWMLAAPGVPVPTI
jgi:hypothetical protein